MPPTNLAESDLEHAALCYQWGYFAGALEYGRRHQARNTALRHEAFLIEWFARMSLGGDQRTIAMRGGIIPKFFSELVGGQGAAELALCFMHRKEFKKVAASIKFILDVASKQSGVLVMVHPSAVLELSNHALAAGDFSSAVKLLNCALGSSAAFLVLSDVERLGNLLAALDAPLALWADWAQIFVRHTTFSTARESIFETHLKTAEAKEWAREQNANSKEVLLRIIALAPFEVHEMLARVAPHLGRADFATILNSHIPPSGRESRPVQTNALWLEASTLQLRYRWMELLQDNEKHFLINADWAMFNTPTTDFSMALAQWWRLVEAVLKRTLVKPLIELYEANPMWLEWDRSNLSEKARRAEAIFMEKVAVRHKAERLTLGELLLLLKKCIPAKLETERRGKSGSRLRLEAERFFERHHQQISPLIHSNWVEPSPLLDANIDFFRNKSSHNEPIQRVDALTGRIVACNILRILFEPEIRRMGLVPILVVNKL